LAKILAFFARTTAVFAKKIIITLVSEKSANFLADNWQKMAANCDHNIDPGPQVFLCFVEQKLFVMKNLSIEGRRF
jgi:hypothetical protein